MLWKLPQKNNASNLLLNAVLKEGVRWYYLSDLHRLSFYALQHELIIFISAFMSSDVMSYMIISPITVWGDMKCLQSDINHFTRLILVTASNFPLEYLDKQNPSLKIFPSLKIWQKFCARCRYHIMERRLISSKVWYRKYFPFLIFKQILLR